jgi:3'-phosphoadenosine 5'-phosphosulfate (PAPS) 3'-phosphatase
MKIYDTDDFQIEIKLDSSPLTIADKRANDIICQFLSKNRYQFYQKKKKTDSMQFEKIGIHYGL